MNMQIRQLMEEFHNQIPNVETIRWNTWTNNILNDGNPYLQRFIDLLSQFSEDDLRKIYKKFRSKPPTVIFKDIADKFVKFYTHNTGVKPVISSDLNLNLIIQLLAYALVVEAVVPNYFDRIDERFGWINM